jgi:uncharacterized protein (TIRG00374 family)
MGFITSANVRSLLLGLLVSVSFGVLLIYQVDVEKSWEILGRIDLRLMHTPLLITGGLFALRPWRWQQMFPNTHRPSFRSSFRVFGIAIMANNLFPARGGDVLRCFLITREHKSVSASLALATLGLEKVFDGMTLLLVVLSTVIFVSSPDWLARMGLLSSLFFGSAVAALLLLHFRSVWLIARIRPLFRAVRLVALGERIVTLLASFVEGLTVMTSPLRLLGLLLATLVIWLGEAIRISALGLAMNIDISFPAAILVSAVLGLGLALPAGPGFVGTFEFFAVAGLSLTGVEADSALALALVIHAWSFLGTSIFGLIGIATARLSRADRNSLISVTAGRLPRARNRATINLT